MYSTQYISSPSARCLKRDVRNFSPLRSAYLIASASQFVSGIHIPQQAKDAIQKVRAFISNYGSSRLETAFGDPPIGSERRILDRAGWKDNGIYYLSINAWSDCTSSDSLGQRIA